jgi:Ca2+-transporting ATPase
MITGDYPATASSIAAQAGLATPEVTITGPELAALDDEVLAARVAVVNVFARVVPQQKLRLVEALQRSGEIVAMTGDGVNDAPALKAAHIGIAMGGRGTDVAREAASLVRLDDEFPSIVAAVALGRRIFDNIKKAFTYTFAIHVPIAGLSIAPLFVPDWPLLLMPVHIVFLELIIDPACSLIFEAEEAEPDGMKRPPRDPREKLFSRAAIGWGVLQGAGALALSLGAYLLAGHLGESQPAARAVLFTAVVVANLCLILGNRSISRSTLSMMREPNRALWWVVGGTAFFLTLVLAVPWLRGVFHFSLPAAAPLAMGLGAGLATWLWVDVLKLLRGRRGAGQGVGLTA